MGTHDDLTELTALQAQGAVTLRTEPYALDAAPDALADLDQGGLPGGRAGLVPDRTG